MQTAEKEVEWFYEYLQDLLELTKDVIFILDDWNVKVGSQETPGVTGKFGFGVQNEQCQRLTRVLLRDHVGYSKHPLPTFAFQSPIMKRTSFLGVSSRRSCRSS